MEKLLSIILSILLVAAALPFTAFAATALSAPTASLFFDGAAINLEWRSVAKADHYTVEVTKEGTSAISTENVTTLDYVLDPFLDSNGEGNYKIRIKAVPDSSGTYSESAWSELSYTHVLYDLNLTLDGVKLISGKQGANVLNPNLYAEMKFQLLESDTVFPGDIVVTCEGKTLLLNTDYSYYTDSSDTTKATLFFNMGNVTGDVSVTITARDLLTTKKDLLNASEPITGKTMTEIFYLSDYCAYGPTGMIQRNVRPLKFTAKSGEQLLYTLYGDKDHSLDLYDVTDPDNITDVTAIDKDNYDNNGGEYGSYEFTKDATYMLLLKDFSVSRGGQSIAMVTLVSDYQSLTTALASATEITSLPYSGTAEIGDDLPIDDGISTYFAQNYSMELTQGMVLRVRCGNEEMGTDYSVTFQPEGQTSENFNLDSYFGKGEDFYYLVPSTGTYYMTVRGNTIYNFGTCSVEVSEVQPQSLSDLFDTAETVESFFFEQYEMGSEGIVLDRENLFYARAYKVSVDTPKRIMIRAENMDTAIQIFKVDGDSVNPIDEFEWYDGDYYDGGGELCFYDAAPGTYYVLVCSSNEVGKGTAKINLLVDTVMDIGDVIENNAVDVGDSYSADYVLGSEDLIGDWGTFYGLILRADMRSGETAQIRFSGSDAMLDTVIEVLQYDRTVITEKEYDDDNLGGNHIGNFMGESALFTADEDGTYYFLLRGIDFTMRGETAVDFNISTALTMDEAFENAEPITLPVSERLLLSEETLFFKSNFGFYGKMYSFDLKADDTLELYGFSGSAGWDIVFELYYVGEEELVPVYKIDGSGRWPETDSFTATEDGTYALLVRGYNAEDLGSVQFCVAVDSGSNQDLNYTDSENLPPDGALYSYDAQENILTLKDGFSFDEIILLPDGATVKVLKKATLYGNGIIQCYGDLLIELSDGAELSVISDIDSAFNIYANGSIRMTGCGADSSIVNILSNFGNGIYSDGAMILENLTVFGCASDEPLYSDMSFIRLSGCTYDFSTGEEGIQNGGTDENEIGILIENSTILAYCYDEEGVSATEGNIVIRNSILDLFTDEDVVEAENGAVSITGSSFCFLLDSASYKTVRAGNGDITISGDVKMYEFGGSRAPDYTGPVSDSQILVSPTSGSRSIIFTVNGEVFFPECITSASEPDFAELSLSGLEDGMNIENPNGISFSAFASYGGNPLKGLMRLIPQSYQIVDANGTVVLEGELMNGANEVDPSSLFDGSYTLRIFFRQQKVNAHGVWTDMDTVETSEYAFSVSGNPETDIPETGVPITRTLLPMAAFLLVLPAAALLLRKKRTA